MMELLPRVLSRLTTVRRFKYGATSICLSTRPNWSVGVKAYVVHTWRYDLLSVSELNKAVNCVINDEDEDVSRIYAVNNKTINSARSFPLMSAPL